MGFAQGDSNADMFAGLLIYLFFTRRKNVRGNMAYVQQEDIDIPLWCTYKPSVQIFIFNSSSAIPTAYSAQEQLKTVEYMNLHITVEK